MTQLEKFWESHSLALKIAAEIETELILKDASLYSLNVAKWD